MTAKSDRNSPELEVGDKYRFAVLHPEKTLAFLSRWRQKRMARKPVLGRYEGKDPL